MSLTGYNKNRTKYIETGQDKYRLRMDRHLTPVVAAHISAVEHQKAEQLRLVREAAEKQREEERAEWWTNFWAGVIAGIAVLVAIAVVVTAMVAAATFIHPHRAYRYQNQNQAVPQGLYYENQPLPYTQAQWPQTQYPLTIVPPGTTFWVLEKGGKWREQVTFPDDRVAILHTFARMQAAIDQVSMDAAANDSPYGVTGG